jgi:hypothetical protein
MKTEGQIRQHIKAIRKTITPGCSCPNCMGCYTAIGALKWALGDVDRENPEMEERMAKFISDNT